MTDSGKIRYAHGLIDDIANGYTPEPSDLETLRSLLPEPPRQKTLEEISEAVKQVWGATAVNAWPEDTHGILEVWLWELQDQLDGLIESSPNPAHPEFLETEADYAAAPEGTIAASGDELPWTKDDSSWLSVEYIGAKDDRGMSPTRRYVLRWGWGE